MVQSDNTIGFKTSSMVSIKKKNTLFFLSLTASLILTFMFLKRLFSIGDNPDLTDTESKRVVLLNQIVVLGIISIFGIGTLTIVVDEENRLAQAVIAVFEIGFLSSIFFWQRIRWYKFARILFLVITYVFIFLLSKVVKTDVHNDYYFGVLAILPLLFFDNKIITYGGLILAIFCFYLDKEVKDLFLYGKFQLTDQTSTALLLFLLVFMIVNYFKTLNQKNEKSLEQKSKELKSLNKFQSQFFINISHEIRTPLTLIRGNNEMLGEHQVTAYNPEIEKYHSTIAEQTAKIKTIVDDVLDMAKMQTDEFRLQFKTIELDEFLKRIYFSFHTAFQQKGITYQYKNGPKNSWLNADPVYLERALNNIILNALKYTGKGGIIDIWYEKWQSDSIAIVVKDSGIGIAKEHIPKIFDRFYQADNGINKTGGSGIGLAFSKEVIAMHYGKIEVDSNLGEGTVFKIKLPLAPQPLETSLSKPIGDIEPIEKEIATAPLFTLLSKPSVLIVDDHTEMRNYIEGILVGYECIQATDGMDALDLLASHNIDFVITDYMMPNLDGYGLIKEMKQRELNIPILMLTARGDMNDKLEVLRLGIDDYLTKPFSKNELLIRIQNSLANNTAKGSYRQERQIDNIGPDDEQFLGSIKKYVLESCSDAAFGLEDLVEEFAISKSTLYRKIKSLSGLNPNQFINEIKLQQARSLVELKQCDSLKQLSFAVGFTKPSYFSGLYEKRFGSKPFKDT